MTQRTVIISGATGGIGQAIAKDLARDGKTRLGLLGRNLEKLNALGNELNLPEDRCKVAACDVTDRGQVNDVIKSMLASFGAIDCLICASGINVAQRSLRSIDPADFDRVIAANLTGTFNVIHAVLPSMRDRGDGLIIQIGSVSSLRANTLAGAAYSASKFAQMALGTIVSREERGRNIRSTVICPGEVNTPFLDQRAGRPGGGEGGRRQMILQPEDIAAAVRFVIELPPRAHVAEMIIKPTIDDFF